MALVGDLVLGLLVVVVVVAVIAMIVMSFDHGRRRQAPFFVWLDGFADALMMWWTFEWLSSLDFGSSFDLNLD